jgi:hypothetical protein
LVFEASVGLSSTRTDENVQKLRHLTHEDRRPTINGVLMNLRENIGSKRPNNWRIFTSSQDTNIAGSSLTRTTAWHPFANGMIENLTRQLRDVLITMPKNNGPKGHFCSAEHQQCDEARHAGIISRKYRWFLMNKVASLPKIS